MNVTTLKLFLNLWGHKLGCEAVSVGSWTGGQFTFFFFCKTHNLVHNFNILFIWHDRCVRERKSEIQKERKREGARAGQGCLSRPVWAVLHAALSLLVEPRLAGATLSALAADAWLAAEVAAGANTDVLHVGEESLGALWNTRAVWRTHSHKDFFQKVVSWMF